MDLTLKIYILFSIPFLLIFFSVPSALQPSDCEEFKVIPPNQYDRDTSAADNITKRPLGYMFDSAKYPGVQSGGNLKNACAFLKNLTGRYVEVMVSDSQKVNFGKGVSVGTQWSPNGPPMYLISVDICLDGHNRLSKSGLVTKKIYSFLRQNVSSKFHNFWKTNPFCFLKGH